MIDFREGHKMKKQDYYKICIAGRLIKLSVYFTIPTFFTLKMLP